MSYVVEQLQATDPKNQIVMGLRGKQAVLSAEDFGQVSVINIPDPGQATGSKFVLTDTTSGSQQINSGIGLVGDLVFSNAADRAIRFDKTNEGAGAKLSIVGNDAKTGTAGSLVLQAGNAVAGNTFGGGVFLIGGDATGNTTGGAVTLISGRGDSVNSGPVGIMSGTSKTGSTGSISINTGDSKKTSGGVQLITGAGADTGDIKITTGNASATTSGKIEIKTGIAATPGGINISTAGSTGEGNGGDIKLQCGSSSGAGFGGLLSLISGGSNSGTAGNVVLDVGNGLPNGSILIGNLGNDVPAAITINRVTAESGPTTIYCQVMPVVGILGNATVRFGESGSVFNVTSGPNITLPAAAAGLRYTFVLSGIPGADVKISSVGGGGTMKGMTVSNKAGSAVTSVAGAGATYASFVVATATIGDRWDIICADGVNWVANGTSGGDAGVVFGP